MLTDRVDDVAVAETAARLARARRAPLLLIAVLPPDAKHTGPGPASGPARAVPGRVMPKLGPLALDCIHEVFHLPPGRPSRLAAAKELLTLAARRRAPDVVAARRGPEGLDVFSLIEAAGLRGGPCVHAVAPGAWVPLRLPSL
ncbi:universal stress protein [Streptomyces sp. GC420]|nr:universal stress protein [Streptomyces sp. GC420]